LPPSFSSRLERWPGRRPLSFVLFS
jgi:hypothetical protein